MAAVAALMLAGCGSDDDRMSAFVDPDVSVPAPLFSIEQTRAPIGGDAPPPASAPKTSSAFLRPTPEQEQTLIAALTAIDPGLTTRPERAVSRSVDTCDDIRKGKDPATVTRNAAARYTGGDVQVDDAKAAKIVMAIKNAYCKA